MPKINFFYKNKENFILVLCILTIVVLSGRNILNAEGIVLLNDEFGYWGIAASLAGNDWKTLLSITPYYAFGYSIILLPLFYLGLPMTIMYKIALIVNVLMLLIAFFLTFLCLKQWFKSLQNLICILIAFITTIYTSNIFQAHGAWSETALYLLYWLLCFILTLAVQKKKLYLFLSFAGLCTLMYCVHMRSIGVIMAAAITIIIAALKKQIPTRQFLVLLLISFFTLYAASTMHSNITDSVFFSSTIAQGNTFEGQSGKIVEILTTSSGFVQWIYSICGKLFYIATSTLLLGYFAIRFFTERTLHFLFSKPEMQDESDIIFLFLFLSFGATFGINTIAMHSIYGRLDVSVYGRYMEFTFGPMIAIGLALLLTRKITKKEIFIHLALLWGLSWIVNHILVEVYNSGQKTFNWYCVSSWKPFFLNYGTVDKFAYFLALFCSLIIFYFLCIDEGYKRKHISYQTRSLLILTAIAGIWIWSDCTQSPFEAEQSKCVDSRKQAISFIEEVGQKHADIFLIVSDEDELLTNRIKFLQADLPNINIEILTETDYSKMTFNPNDILAAIYGSSIQTQLQNHYIQALENKWYSLYISPGSIWENSAYKNMLKPETRATFYTNAPNSSQLPSEGSENISHSKLSVNVNSFYDSETDIQGVEYQINEALSISGTTFFGPYIKLPEASYRVGFEFELTDVPSDTDVYALYQVTANNGQDILAKGMLTEDVIENGKITKFWLDFHAQNGEGLNQLEFVVYNVSGASLYLHSIYLYCTGAATELLCVDSNEYEKFCCLLDMDEENLPVSILTTPIRAEFKTVNELATDMPNRSIFISDNMESIKKIYGLILADNRISNQQNNLGEYYTIVMRIGNYTLWVPNSSSLLKNYADAGGILLSSGDEISLRYYSSSSKISLESINAELPPGIYHIRAVARFSNASTEKCGTFEWNDGVIHNIQEIKSLNISEDFIYEYHMNLESPTSLPIETFASGQLSNPVQFFDVFVTYRGEYTGKTNIR